MKILLDECLPRPLKREFAGYDIATVPEMGWSGTTNGKLLQAAVDAGFTVFITVDQNLTYQQNLKNFPIGILVLSARRNKLADLVLLVPKALDVLPKIQPSEIVKIEAG